MPHLMPLGPESHGDVDADLGPESEEMSDDEPSVMEFSTSVSAEVNSTKVVQQSLITTQCVAHRFVRKVW